MTWFSRRAAGCLAAVAGLLLATASPCLAQSGSDQRGMIRDPGQLVQSLRAGGYNIVVRHGATFSNQADTDPFNFDNVARQRNLNDKGKALAKAFGDAIHRAGVPVGEVYTSKFNRAYETAVLAGFEDIEPTVDLTEGGLVVTPDENNQASRGIPQDAGASSRPGQEQLPHNAQAQHRRRAGQGLVRRQGRRSVDFQAHWWQIRAGRAGANG